MAGGEQSTALDALWASIPTLAYEKASYRPFFNDGDRPAAVGVLPVNSAPTLTGSQNLYTTTGGTVQKRPPFGILLGGGTVKEYRIIERLWGYQSLPDSTGTSYSYLIASMKNTVTGEYELHTLKLNAGTWTLVSLRDSDISAAPHQVVVSRGIAYVTSFPPATVGDPPVANTEKLGTIQLDGKTGTIVASFWGALGPQTAARVKGATTRLTAAAAAGDGTLTVSSTTGFTSPTGTIYIGFEKITYTGTTATTFTGCTRGAGGTTAAAYSVNEPVLYRNWTASDHKVTVNYGWYYAYTYKSAAGHETDRSDIERNPDKTPSNTGPFIDQCPTIQVVAPPDAATLAAFPTICIYRTTDGGGSFLFVEELSAGSTPGATLDYRDDSLASGSGSTYNDPIPDTKLDSARVAPSLTSNSPPPTVNPPLVIGTDTPSVNMSTMEAFGQRLWKGVENVLYFSGQEEITAGIPEESWPSGDSGTYYRLPFPVVALKATSQALYVMTTRDVYMLTGSNLETFSVKKISDTNGMNPYAQMACTGLFDRIAYNTFDNRIVVVTGEQFTTISDPIATEWLGNSQNSQKRRNLQLVFHSSGYKQWLIAVSPICQDNSASGGYSCPIYTYNSSTGAVTDRKATLLTYDWKISLAEQRHYWQTPWVTQTSALCSFGGELYSAMIDPGYLPLGTHPGTVVAQMTDDSEAPMINGAYIVYKDVSITPVVGGTPIEELKGYNCRWRVGSFRNPTGNHVNKYRDPAMTTVFLGGRLDFSRGGSESGVPSIWAGYDYAWQTDMEEQLPTRDTARIVGLRAGRILTQEFDAHKATTDVGLYITDGSIPDSEYFAIYRLMLKFSPEKGY